MKARTAAAASSARAIAAPETGVGQEQLDFARAVRFYLQQTPRQLPSRFLYDALGSALFDAICHLPWYGITRAELRLLRQHAGTIGQALGRGGRVGPRARGPVRGGAGGAVAPELPDDVPQRPVPVGRPAL